MIWDDIVCKFVSVSLVLTGLFFISLLLYFKVFTIEYHCMKHRGGENEFKGLNVVRIILFCLSAYFLFGILIFLFKFSFK